MIGPKGDKASIVPLTEFCNLLANGHAPIGVQPFLAGANGFAFQKDSKSQQAEAMETSDSSLTRGSTPCQPDARPVCCGEVWRRLVGKALLDGEKGTLVDYLKPFQLAVAVPCGAEVMPHLARAWMNEFKNDTSRVLVDYDESNAHNAVDRCAFLDRMAGVAPGLARWLDFIYPTSAPTYVFYKGRIIESRAGGQQGCPLIGACHAVVQRSLLEALGVVPVAPQTAALLPVLSPPADLDMTPMFADDGFFAGRAEEVKRALQHLVPVMPLLGLKFSKLDVIPAAGEGAQFDRGSFRDLGCKVVEKAEVTVMKCPIGDQDYCGSVLSKRVGKAQSILDQIGDLPDSHCALYLMQYQTGRMEYISRSTPFALCQDALLRFDLSVRNCFESIMGSRFTNTEWQQARLPMRYSGLGMRSAHFYADAAYLASRAATQGLCEDIWDGFTLDESDPVHTTINRLNERLPDEQVLAVVQGSLDAIPSQQSVSKSISKFEFERLRENAAPFQRARMNAFSAPGVNRWLQDRPSQSLDKHFTGNELVSSIRLTLGVDVCDGRSLCKFCATPIDAKGIHPSSCGGGGDCIVRHNEVRDKLFKWSQRGRLNPELEKAGILNEDAVMVCLRRPADVLVDNPSNRLEKVALDVKVINSLGPSHFNSTLVSSLAAADEYRLEVMEHLDTASRCAERNVRYEPMVFTAQGGIQSNAESLLTLISESVAKAEGTHPELVKAEIVQDLSRSLARAAARALARRTPRIEMVTRDERILAESVTLQS